MVTTAKPLNLDMPRARILASWEDEGFRRFVANFEKLEKPKRSLMLRMMRCFLGELTSLQRARMIGDLRRTCAGAGVTLPRETVEALQRTKVRAHRVPDRLLRERRQRLHRAVVDAFAMRCATGVRS
jgi:hypothetical protein